MVEHGAARNIIGMLVLLSVTVAAQDNNSCDCTPVEPPGEPPAEIPLPVALFFGVILLFLSGCFSGLTLGLLGLDTMALNAVATAGSSPQKEYALAILPLRKDGNLLLCTLLLGNVMVNVMIPILLADITGGLFGFIFSTVFIVIFGEIVPQATCSKHALYIGSKSIPLVTFFRCILYIFAKPIAVILDKVLGRDAGQVYDKEELKQVLWQHLHADKLVSREYKMITRALDLQKTEVADIATPEDKIYKLDITTELTPETLTEIWQTGHSRIPITESLPITEMRGKDRETYVGVLYTKDLITLRSDDRITVKQILGFYNRGPPLMMDKHMKLDKVLDTFRKGESHIALVTETVSRGGGDPVLEVIGVVTLEDVIEQLVGEEIIDEHDNYVDIQAVRRERTNRDTALPLGMLRQAKKRLTHEQARSLTQYLQYTLSDPLAGMSEEQLFHLILAVGVKEFRLPVKETPRSLQSPNNIWVYKKGKAMEFFTLIVSGRVEAISSEEGFRSEYGPNMFLGSKVLREGSSTLCDFDCRVLESPVRVVQLSFHDIEKAKSWREGEEAARAQAHQAKQRQPLLPTPDFGASVASTPTFTPADLPTTEQMRYSPTSELGQDP